jgi:hypothetical protein
MKIYRKTNIVNNRILSRNPAAQVVGEIKPPFRRLQSKNPSSFSNRRIYRIFQPALAPSPVRRKELMCMVGYCSRPHTCKPNGWHLRVGSAARNFGRLAGGWNVRRFFWRCVLPIRIQFTWHHQEVWGCLGRPHSSQRPMPDRISQRVSIFTKASFKEYTRHTTYVSH